MKYAIISLFLIVVVLILIIVAAVVLRRKGSDKKPTVTHLALQDHSLDLSQMHVKNPVYHDVNLVSLLHT
jgi:hypothetical protein